MTDNFDEKHVMKRIRESFKSPNKGTQVGNVTLTFSDFQRFLSMTDCPNPSALLHPDDAMNVGLAFDFCFWLSKVRDIDSQRILQLGIVQEWEAMKLLGEVGTKTEIATAEELLCPEACMFDCSACYSAGPLNPTS